MDDKYLRETRMHPRAYGNALSLIPSYFSSIHICIQLFVNTQNKQNKLNTYNLRECHILCYN